MFVHSLVLQTSWVLTVHGASRTICVCVYVRVYIHTYTYLCVCYMYELSKIPIYVPPIYLSFIPIHNAKNMKHTYISTLQHKYTHIHIYRYHIRHIHTYIHHACIHTYIPTGRQAGRQAERPKQTYVHVTVYVYVYIYTNRSIFIFVYTYVYTHIHNEHGQV